MLDHSPESVDLSYARDGLPFLMDHDTTRQIGLIEDITVARDGRMRGLVRQGNHPDAGWVFADIRAGIRPNISVGYRVQAMQLEASDETGDTYRVTSWLPMEGSTVPVPADITVGANREAPQEFPVSLTSREAKETTMSETAQAPAAGAAPVAVGVDHDAARRTRNAEMVALANLAGRPELLADALGRDLSPAQFARELQEAKIAAAAAAPSATVQLTPREQQAYSFGRALGAQVALMTGNPRAWEHAGFEKEISDEIKQRTNRNTSGFFVPLSLQTRAAVTGQTAGTTSLGGAGVATQVLDLIEVLRNNMVVRQAGARVLTGLSANISFPRQTAANTLNWTGENPASANANGNMTFDNVTLSPKTAMVSTAASRQAILQFNQDLEAIIRDDLAQVIARGLDLAALAGTGSSNQPTGVMAAGVSTITTTFGSNGAAPDWAALVGFETQLASDNAPTGSPWRWITTPGIRGKLRQTLQNTVAGAQWCWAADNTMVGYEALVTTQMPTNYTAGTSTTICHGMALGNWSELLIGEFGGGVEIIVDPYTVANQNMVQYHAIVMADIGVRHLKSFAITKAAKTS